MKARSRLYVAWFRWLALVGILVFTAWACVSHPLAQPTPDPVQESTNRIMVTQLRELDLLFMIDNSGSMKPKQDKMKAQFPKLIDALRDPSDSTLPDLHVAIIDSDLGAGASSRCGAAGAHGDMGKFQMRNAVGCGANADARWLEYTKGKAINFTGPLNDVFGCLASAVGVSGCGFEHQLAAIEWAFFLKDNESQKKFLRQDAYLGIVILTDEDDCSATVGSGMFGSLDATNSSSLRCATRGHKCDGATLTTPMTAAVSVPYESCHARTDSTCDDTKVDTSTDTSCNPLLDVKQLATDIKTLKGADVDQKMLVAAIYGTPRQDDTSAKKYVIDKVPNRENPQGPTEIFDYWPICYDPAYMPSGSGFDATAADHGATGGLRISAFLNEFKKENALAYSICEADFGPAMDGIGNRLRYMMNDLCVPFKLVDTSKDDGIQPDCRVAYSRPVRDDKGGLAWKEDDDGLPKCDSTHTSGCWELKLGNPNGTAEEKNTATRCKPTATTPSQLINIVRDPNDALDDGTKAVMYCLSCVDPIPGLPVKKGCDY